jgi:hypothetical protein
VGLLGGGPSRGATTRCSAQTTTAPRTPRPAKRIAQLAIGGIRLIAGELWSDVTKTRKDRTRGRLRIDYGNPREPQAAIA